MVGGFPTIVETYALRARAETAAELLREHAIEALVTPSSGGAAWDVVVPIAQYGEAKRLTRELPD